MTDHEIATLSTGFRIEVLKSATRIAESVLLQGNNLVVTDVFCQMHEAALKLLQKEYESQTAEIAATPPAK